MSELIPIQADTKTIQSCFNECLYTIPPFQRPYSWDEGNLEDYCNDVLLAQSDLFFGSTVTYLTERRPLFNNTYAVIDGQQRLTTSTIALSVIRDFFQKLAENDIENISLDERVSATAAEQAITTQKYIIVKDDDSIEHLVLKRPEPMFMEQIQRPNSIPSGIAGDQSASKIADARNYFENQIATLIAGLDSPSQIVTELKQLRNNILMARVIQVELSSEEDAFLIFETLNTRGADLQLSDLIKNLLVRSVRSAAHDQHAVNTRWSAIMNKIVDPTDDLGARNRFIWQSWNSRRPAVTEAELFKSLKGLLNSGKLQELDYMQELETDARIFELLANPPRNFPTLPSSKREALAIPEVQRAFRALSIFNVSVANSAILALVRKYNESAVLSKKQLLRSIESIENFHFVFTQLAKAGSTGGTRSRYNRFAASLESAQDSNEVAQAIDRLQVGLKETAARFEVAAKAEFARLFYASDASILEGTPRDVRRRSDKNLVRYVLARMAGTAGQVPQGSPVNDWTIEHLRPQSYAGTGVTSPEYSIGNLTLLPPEVNSKLGSLDFHKKRVLLAASAAPRDQTLQSWIADQSITVLSASLIELRTNELTRWALDTIWRI